MGGQCSMCPPGTYNALGTIGACQPCPTGMYAPTPGSVQCTVCPWPSYVSSDATECRSAASLVSAILSALVVLVFCIFGLVQCCKVFCSLNKAYEKHERDGVPYSGQLMNRLE